jgi:DNA-binding MarR family transcriptional regulator
MSSAKSRARSGPARPPAGQARYDLERSIGYLLNRAASLIAARFDDLKLHGVSLQAWRILATLSQSDGQSLSELANHTGAELSYLSRSAAQLEERGLVQREPSALDKRASLFSLTAQGHALVAELAPRARGIERESVQDVPAADLAATLRTLRAVCHNLVPHPDAAGAVNRKLTVARRVKQKALAQGESPAPRGQAR